ncbi:MAG: Aspartate--tRNA ligase [Mycoplasmataceae bacterium]|nr:MAG: Aspartate--tRNA ligase [Mycoplasmataceae bacterium]
MKNNYNLKDLNNKEISLNGWIKKIRKLGKLMFFDLQCEEEDVQVIVWDEKIIKEINESLQTGDLININGNVKLKKSKKNSSEEEFEILLNSWKLINKTIQLPFEIKDDLDLKEDNKYKYRYLDLRRDKSKKIILIKNELLHYIRNFFYNENFTEIETPILSQSSPEGANTFIVPSNLKNRFYTLPQSPQIFKQILMISGFKKYYQIAKTFRNENARSNRQLEFLQLDVEMSFASQKYIFNLIEKLMNGFLENILKINKEKITFESLTFEECFNNYGNDKPDLRNPIKIKNFDFKITSLGKNENLKNIERGIFINNNLEINWEEIKEIINNISLKSKFEFSLIEKYDDEINVILDNLKENLSSEKLLKNCEDGSYILIGGEKNIVLDLLSKIRNTFNKLFINNSEGLKEYKFLWITDWPLFEYNEEENKIISLRHAFTLPKEEYIEKIMSGKIDPLLIKTESYDLVCNGEEFASGSLRIYKRDLQEKIFEILGFDKENSENNFGYFLKALEFAAPPHGGIGLGIERMLVTFLNLKNLKETIAFPKNIDGTCSLTGAPNLI